MILAIEPNVKTMEPSVSLLYCLCAMIFLMGFGCVDFFCFLDLPGEAMNFSISF